MSKSIKQQAKEEKIKKEIKSILKGLSFKQVTDLFYELRTELESELIV